MAVKQNKAVIWREVGYEDVLVTIVNAATIDGTREVAQMAGVSQAQVSQVTKGLYAPSQKLLAYFGYRQRVIYERIET